MDDRDVIIHRIGSKSVDYYLREGDRQAQRMKWSDLDPKTFAALLRALAATDEEKQACAALEAEIEQF